MTSATAHSPTLVASSLDHPHARTPADQPDGEPASIYGGPTTGRDTFSRINGTLDGQIMAFFVMVVAAAEVVMSLAIIMAIFKTRRSASADEANPLKY